MKSHFRIEQEGFLSPENAETRCFNAARPFCLVGSFQNKIPEKCSQFCESALIRMALCVLA